MKNNELNQDVTETSAYIIVTIDSKSKLILPKNIGILFMQIWSEATEIFQEWSSEPKRLRGVDKDFEVRFISEETFKEMKMASMIGADTEDE